MALPGVDPAPLDASIEVRLRLRSGEELRGPLADLSEASTRRLPDGGVVANVGSLGKLEISADGALIDIFPSADCGPGLVQHLIFEHALPRRFALLGHTALHANAVSIDGGIVGLLGPSGSGKSTLSGALASAGGRWVADDFLLLEIGDERTVAIPTVVGTQLRADSASALGLVHETAEMITGKHRKRRWTVCGVSEPEQVRSLFSLDRREDTDGPVTCTPMMGRSAMVLLAERWFLSPTEAVSPTTFLQRSSDLLRSTPLYQLSYPGSLARLGEVVETMRAVASCGLVSSGTEGG